MEQWVVIITIIGMLVTILQRRRFRFSGTAHGTANWASLKEMKRAGLLAARGLLVGRMLGRRRGKPIRMPNYVHTALIGPSGSGKGVSFIVPTLLTYRAGSCVIFDPKGELYRMTAARRRAMGRNECVLDPYGLVTAPGKSDSYNPLFEACADPPRLFDDCRAMANSLVVRAQDGDKDPHWNNAAEDVLTGMLLATAMFMPEEHRTLSIARDMLTSPEIFPKSVERLQSAGGPAARIGNQIARLMKSEKEASSVLSVASVHTSFLDSLAIQGVLGKGTFKASSLLENGTDLFVVLPVDQLEAMKGYLRLTLGSLLRYIQRHRVKNNGEVLFLLDECACFGSGLQSLESAFQIGRGAGVKLFTAWQSIEQANTAFPGKPNLVLDNSDAHLYLAPNSYATAKLISDMLGPWSMAIESCNLSYSGGTSHTDAPTSDSRSRSRNWSESRNYSEVSRPLLYPNEVLQMSPECVIAFVRGCSPIMARRLKWYSDPLFKKPSLLTLPLALFRMIRP
jgi:type IV secretion system protein VirD4